jgi:serine/threonine-protein kinase RsbW
VTKFKLSINSEMKNLTLVSDFITDVARNLSLNGDETFAVQMAVDEACANVIEHAYAGRQNGQVSIICQLLNDEVIVTIRDSGRMFDPQAVPRPDIHAPIEERDAGGLGLYLMEKLMDQVKFEFDPEKGNKLVMKKKVRREKLPVSTLQ